MVTSFEIYANLSKKMDSEYFALLLNLTEGSVKHELPNVNKRL